MDTSHVIKELGNRVDKCQDDLRDVKKRIFQFELIHSSGKFRYFRNYQKYTQHVLEGQLADFDLSELRTETSIDELTKYISNYVSLKKEEKVCQEKVKSAKEAYSGLWNSLLRKEFESIEKKSKN